MWGAEKIYDSVTELKRARVKGRLCFLGIINYGGNFNALGLYSIFLFCTIFGSSDIVRKLDVGISKI